MRYMSMNQRAYLEYIATHPGCTKAAVDRACRINPLAGHAHVYDGITRLIRRGFVEDRGTSNRCILYVVCHD